MTPPLTQSTPDPQAGQQALLHALDNLLEPLAQLCVGKSISIQEVEERLRQAFVRAARQANEGANPDRLNSRISTLTGLTRREVTRIQGLEQPARPPTHTPVTSIITRWLSLPDYQNGSAGPMELPRTGAAPSFEALAHSVTKDVHPRSLLDAMSRLNLVTLDVESDRVRLIQNAYVPRSNWTEMMHFLGANGGDHLRAAVANVLGSGEQHFEQALYADELSSESLVQARQLISAQWRHLLTEMVPQMETLMKNDAEAGRPQTQSLRLGLYSWMQAMPGAAAPDQQKDAKEPDHE